MNNYEIMKRSIFDKTDYLLVKYPVIDNPHYKNTLNIQGFMHINNPKQVNPVVIIKVNPDKTISKLYTIYYPYNDNTGGSEMIVDYQVHNNHLLIIKGSYFNTFYTLLNLAAIDKPVAENIAIGRVYTPDDIDNTKPKIEYFYQSTKEFTENRIVLNMKLLRDGREIETVQKTIEYDKITKQKTRSE